MDTHDFRRFNPRFMAPNYQENLTQINKLRRFSERKGVTLPALALAWILHKNPTCIPIPGTRTTLHLNEWVHAANIELNARDIEKIDQILPVGWAHGDRYREAQSGAVERYC
jgi:aryl-alcohol dehydrogenase-like predicted oxidoreductase